MTQYQHNQSTTENPEKIKPRVNNSELELRNLKELVRDQQQQIQDLQRELKRLKNDLRVAINAFNLKHG